MNDCGLVHIMPHGLGYHYATDISLFYKKGLMEIPLHFLLKNIGPKGLSK